MFKLLALFLLAAAVVAKPTDESSIGETVEGTQIHLTSGLPSSTTIVQEPTLTKVGDLVRNVPTAVSHQSSTVVHGHTDVVTPIVAPAIKTHITPVVSSFVPPLVRSYPAYYPYSYYYDLQPYVYKTFY